MYNWYEGASLCIAYLAETTSLSDMHNDPWFTRGWTLQELLAPRHIKFYGQDWTQLTKFSNDKKNYDVQHQIELATTITSNELESHLLTRISRRMQWAARRRVTRAKDMVYSLTGIFDVDMSIACAKAAKLRF
ncbi:hypothetical protein BDN70DRAFT_963819, partial [Pholiota conissans]